MTFFVTLLTWLGVLFTLAFAYDLHRRTRRRSAAHPSDGLRSCLNALRDTDMLDAWADIPHHICADPKNRAAAEAAIRAYAQRPTCPIARADCMACLSALAQHR